MYYLQTKVEDNMKYDVVIVGSGAAGLTSAIVAADSGLSVLVLESSRFFGGTTALSGGGAWIPNNHHMAAMGETDSHDEARIYLKAVLGDFYDEPLIEVFLEAAPEMLSYMESNTELRLAGSDIPDYEPSKPGWKKGRCLLTQDYDAARLESHFDLLRPPIREMGLFGSMQVSPVDVYVMKNWYRSIGSFSRTINLMVGYLWDRIVAGRGRRLCNGNALAAMLLKSALDKGVTLWNETPAVKLISSEDVINGVVCLRDGEQITVQAGKGVVLASGGFGSNPEMRTEFIPMAAEGWSFQPEECKGEGIRMGLDVGGKMAEGNRSNGIWVPGSQLKSPNKTPKRFPSLFFDRHCPGSIIVDGSTGKRFLNEGSHYQNFGYVTHEKEVKNIWMISDSIAVSKYGIGMVKPKPFRPGPWVKKGYIVSAQSIAELADRTGIPTDNLKETVSKFNKSALTGDDPDYGRGQDAYSQYMGDFEHTPNPSLGPVVAPPFYALKLAPCDLSTMVGLVTDSQSRVLAEGGAAIKGLFAVGLDSNSIMKGGYPGGGSSIGPALTMGYLVGRALGR